MEQYIEATIESSKRTRHILFIIIVVSVMAFCHCWSILDDGWVKQRPVITAAAAAWLLNTNNTQFPVSALSAGKSYLIRHQIYGTNEMNIQNDAMNKDAIEIFKVHIPFFGVSIDINDLGMFAGFAFVVLLLVLRLCLIRQTSNLRLALTAAQLKNSQILKETYEIIAMQQVMTLPPRSTNANYGLLKHIPKLLLLLPFLIQLLISWRDFDTFFIGWTMSHKFTIIAVVAEYTWLIFVFLLTWDCIKLSFETDNEWSSWADKIP